MKVAGTGHRPEDAEAENVVRLKARVKLRYSPADCFISGMAAGFDLWAADEAILLGMEVIAAVPWRGHEPRKGDEDLYNRVLGHASRVVYVTDTEEFPGPKAYHKRNHWMVDNADAVLAYLNPEKESGGTYECVKYARGRKPVANIWFDPPF